MNIRFPIPEFVLGALTMLSVVLVTILVFPLKAHQVNLIADETVIQHKPIELDAVTKQRKPAERPDLLGTEQSPISVRIRKTSQEIAEEAEDRQKKATTDWLIATYTGLLFFATLGLMVATLGLWRLAIRQAKDMRESLAIASKSAEAAKSSADVAQRVFGQLERPYVFTSGISQLLEDSGKLQVVFSISNLGRSPAFIDELWAELFIVPNPIAKVVANLYFKNAVHKMGDVLAAGEKIENIVCYMKPDAVEHLAEIRNRDTYLILKVTVMYIDIFRHSHVSNFHWLYDPDRDYFSIYNAGNPNIFD